jgi:hypothetical protein
MPSSERTKAAVDIVDQASSSLPASFQRWKIRAAVANNTDGFHFCRDENAARCYCQKQVAMKETTRLCCS